MTLVRVVQAVLVVPDRVTWGAQLLGPGSVLDIEADPRLGPLGIDEIAVRWVDVVGREESGWIAQTALVEPVKSARTATLLNVREDLELDAFDRLRDRVRQQQLKDPRSRWTMAAWLRIFGDAHISALVAAVRELGGIVRGTENPVELGRRILRLAVNQEHLMSTETETVEETATAAKKAKAEPVAEKPAKSKKADTSEASASQKLGETLVKLLKKANGNDVAQSIAAKMAEGKSPTAKQLVQLRDGINEAAATAREKEKGELASELSAANRNVRRLARSAAAE